MSDLVSSMSVYVCLGFPKVRPHVLTLLYRGSSQDAIAVRGQRFSDISGGLQTADKLQPPTTPHSRIWKTTKSMSQERCWLRTSNLSVDVGGPATELCSLHTSQDNVCVSVLD
jgi:hypothetical protein